MSNTAASSSAARAAGCGKASAKTPNPSPARMVIQRFNVHDSNAVVISDRAAPATRRFSFALRCHVKIIATRAFQMCLVSSRVCARQYELADRMLNGEAWLIVGAKTGLKIDW